MEKYMFILFFLLFYWKIGTSVSIIIFINIKFCIAKIMATSKTWTQTLDLDPEKLGPWKTRTQKNLDSAKPGPWNSFQWSKGLSYEQGEKFFVWSFLWCKKISFSKWVITFFCKDLKPVAVAYAFLYQVL